MPYADPELRKAKAAIYAREHYLRNKAKKNAASSQWRKDNPAAAAEISRTFYAKHKDAERLRNKNYRKANPEKIAATARDYRVKNKDRLDMYNRRRWEDNKQELSAQQARRRVRDKKQLLVSKANARARRRGIPYGVTVGDIDWATTCPVFGMQLDYAVDGANRFAPNKATLDRTIPALGYVSGNVRVLSWRANMLKCDATVQEIAMLHAYMGAVS